MLPNLYVGFDLRMADPFMVAVRSAIEKAGYALDVKPLLLPYLQAVGDYTRLLSIRDGVMWDEISDAPMSTQFAISRFLVPYLEGYSGFSIFCDSDFMFRADLGSIAKEHDLSKYAVMVVKHDYAPADTTKMDGQVQTQYPRKNWSSFIVFNNAHPSNRWLTPEVVNAVPGRDLHRFCWLEDHEIGELNVEWNWLEGHSPDTINPKAVHYTRGTPDMAGYENAPFADEWREILKGIK
jgi:hypothetical protein